MTDTSSLSPAREDVGALLRARTRDDNGNELGTFNEATRPTGAEIDDLIAQAAPLVRAEVPDVVPDDLDPSVRNLMALRTAMAVEVSYFPDQVATGRSPFDQLRQMYLDGLRAIASNVQGNEPAGPTRIHSLPLRTAYGDPWTPVTRNG